MGCGCGSPVGGSDLYEARVAGGTVLEVAPGRTQGTREEALAAVKARPGGDAFLAKAAVSQDA